MKLRFIMFLTSFIYLMILFFGFKVAAEGIENKKIYNIDESVNLYVYEYDYSGRHYVGYVDKYSNEFSDILNENGEYIDSDMYFPSISSDGKYITFTSSATNIVDEMDSKCYNILEEEYNYCSNIYIYNVLLKSFSIIKKGTEYLNGNSYVSKISGDGKNVVFESLATNNIIIDNNSCYVNEINRCINIFKYSLITDSITLISTYENNYGGDSSSINPSISYDGRYITFQSSASNLGIRSYDYNSCVNESAEGYFCSHVYLVNTKNSTVEIISKNKKNLFNDNSGNSTVSKDGKYVIYESYATNITDKFNYKSHVILFDISKGETKLISVAGNRLNNRDNYLIGISSDSKYVIYHTRSTNLDESGDICVFAYNIDSYKTSFVGKVVSSDIVSTVNDKYIHFYDGEYKTLLIDNIPPTIEDNQEIYIIKDTKVKLDEKIKVEDNLSSKEDLTITIEDNLIFNLVGEYYIEVIVIDEFDNLNSSVVKMVVIEEDIEGPIFNDINEIKILKGSSTLNLSNYIEAYDKVDGITRVYIMNDGGLDLNSKGQYKVLLMSKDNSENISYKEMKIVVYENLDFSYYYEIILILCLFGVIIFSIIRVKK